MHVTAEACFSTQRRFNTAFDWSSHDRRWPRWGRGVGRRWGRKIPEEPLALTLAFLVKVVLFLPLFARTLVMIILLEVPHRGPAMLLKVFLVLWKSTKRIFFQTGDTFAAGNLTQTVDDVQKIRRSRANTCRLSLHVTRELAADAVVISADVMEAPSS